MHMGEKSYYENRLKDLKKFIDRMNTRPILFIGSGFSQRYIKSPTWEGLLDYLIEENPLITKPLIYYIQKFDGDLAKVASVVSDLYYEYAWENTHQFPDDLFALQDKSVYLKYKISEYLIELTDLNKVEDKNLLEEIDILRKLSPESIITTNYDTLLENIFPQYEVIIGQKVIYQNDATNIGHILKIHGSVEEIQSILIEEKDYSEFNENQIYLIAKLFTYFLEHPIIFMGYGINDNNIKSILKNVKKIGGVLTDNKIDNMWFIDWSKSELSNIDENLENSIKIDISSSDFVKINYIKLHSFKKLYQEIYQESVNISLLKDFEAAVYNVVKSDSLTNLEVDIASLRYLTDRENVMKTFTFNSNSHQEKEKKSLLSFAFINEANQLATQYCYTPTKLSIKVFDDQKSHWTKAYKLITQVNKQTGFNIRDSNNIYHIYLDGASRYTEEAVNLLKKVKDCDDYVIEVDGKKKNYSFS